MKQYLEILRDTINGEQKHPVRVDDKGNAVKLDTGTVGIFAAVFRHQMKDGFPLLTTKKVPLRLIAVELEGFLKGITSKKWYQDRRCKIWNEWCNPKALDQKMDEEFVQYNTAKIHDRVKQFQKELMLNEDDLGPIYGYQWRRFNQVYDEDDSGCVETYDQLKDVADRLRNNHYDRRMVVSGWNPVQISRMALPPCHFAWNVVVYGNKLNLIWHQRSCDLMLGVPFNIASYALLLQLLANHSGLEAGELVGTLNDCHIYNNQLDAATAQLEREPRELPTVKIESKDIFEWTHEDLTIVNYNPYPPIQFDLTVH